MTPEDEPVDDVVACVLLWARVAPHTLEMLGQQRGELPGRPHFSIQAAVQALVGRPLPRYWRSRRWMAVHGAVYEPNHPLDEE